MMTQANKGECEMVVRRMWAHLDGMLSEREREQVTRHLEECGLCRSHFDFARAFLDAVHHARPDDSEFSPLRIRVMAALSVEGFADNS